MITPETLTDELLRELLEDAHSLPMHVRHAASVARYSPGATRADRQVACDAINARTGAKP